MFFENLSEAISKPYFAKIPKFETRKKLKFETVTDNDYWLNHWLEHPCHIKPTEQDKEELKKACEDALDDYHFCLCTSLKALIENDMENQTSTLNLHEFHLIVKEEMLSRHMEGVNPTDSFLIDIRAKKEGKLINTEKLWNKARSEGSICPNCQSTEVRSYNKDEWKCYTCRKRFRKHA